MSDRGGGSPGDSHRRGAVAELTNGIAAGTWESPTPFGYGVSAGCRLCAEYLAQHVELDGDEPGPTMLQLIVAPYAEDGDRWGESHSAAIEALDARERLCDALVAAA